MTARLPLAIVVVAAIALASAPVHAQTPGDDQYTDPFGGNSPSEPDRSGDGDDGGGSQPAPEPSGGDESSSSGGTVQPSEPEAAAPAETTAPATTTAQAPDGGEELARTGADAGLLALAGALLLATGLALRRRSGWCGDRA